MPLSRSRRHFPTNALPRRHILRGAPPAARFPVVGLAGGIPRWYHPLGRQAKKCPFYRGFCSCSLRPVGSTEARLCVTKPGSKPSAPQLAHLSPASPTRLRLIVLDQSRNRILEIFGHRLPFFVVGEPQKEDDAARGIRVVSRAPCGCGLCLLGGLDRACANWLRITAWMAGRLMTLSPSRTVTIR